MVQKQQKQNCSPSSHKSILNILHYGTINLCLNMKHNNPRCRTAEFSSHTTNNTGNWTYITNEVLRHDKFKKLLQFFLILLAIHRAFYGVFDLFFFYPWLFSTTVMQPGTFLHRNNVHCHCIEKHWNVIFTALLSLCQTTW